MHGIDLYHPAGARAPGRRSRGGAVAPIGALLAAAALGGVGCGGAAATAERLVERRFAVGGTAGAAVRLDARVEAGDLLVRAGADGVVRVRATLRAVGRDRAEAERALGALRVELSERAGVVTAHVSGPGALGFGRSAGARLEVELPAAAHVDARCPNGRIEVRGAAGGVRAEVRSGAIEIDAPGGTVEATSRNGDVRIAGAPGVVKAEAENGYVRLALSGRVRLDGESSLRTRNGGVRAELPRGFQGGLEVQASVGAVQSNVRLSPEGARGRQVGHLGDGGPLLRLSTEVGVAAIQVAR